MEKKIVILISSSPFGELNNYEALRSSIVFYEHSLWVLWIQDGVYFTLESTDKKRTQQFLRLASELGVKLQVVREYLIERGLDDSELMPEVLVIDRCEYIDLLSNVDLVMSF